MRRLAVWAVAVSSASAQGTHSPDVDPATSALEHGRLVVWIVHPASRNWTPTEQKVAQTPLGLPTTVQEQTAGSFGQAAGDVGQAAGSYGARPSDVGSNAGDVGQTAGSVGRGPQGFGRNSSEVGQTAGSYGQTAGSYGESLSTIAQAGDVRPVSARLSEKHTAQWDGVVVNLRGAFPGLEVRVADIREEDLASTLRDVAGSADAPDVLLGSPLPWTWAKGANGAGWRLVLASLGAVAFPAQIEDGGVTVPSLYPWSPQVAILARANHVLQAKAFAVWISDGGICTSCTQPVGDGLATPAAIAVEALKSVLTTGGADNLDPAYATADADWVRTGALQGLHIIPMEGIKVRTDVIRAVGNERLAMVEARAVVQANNGFGTLHALVVERKDAQGKWRVLQLTPDLPSGMLREAGGMLDDFCSHSATLAKVAGIKQAAPEDDAVVPSRPELWWDNGGGAGMEAVEWQRGDRDRWAGSRLFFVPDRDPHLRTRVTAEFAGDEGSYRWRVWALGEGGALVLSEWKTLRVE